MPATIKELQTELADIHQRITALDLPGKTKRRADAQAHHDSVNKMELSPTLDTWKRADAGNQAHRDLQAAVTAHQQAEAAYSDLKPQAAYLEHLLSAGKLASAATDAMTAASTRIEAAQAAVVDAQATVATITAMIEVESAAFDLARTAHTTSLLVTIKTGGDTKALTPPDREQLNSLERALTAAQAELATAVDAAQQADELRKDAQQQVRIATATGTALAHELALRDYVKAFSAHRVAHRAATGNDFATPRIDILAMGIERANHE